MNYQVLNHIKVRSPSVRADGSGISKRQRGAGSGLAAEFGSRPDPPASTAPVKTIRTPIGREFAFVS
jgi:hypothetical protein